MKKKATISKSIKFPKTFGLAVTKIAGIKITIQSPQSLYIHLNDHVYYIDDSTGKQFVDKWRYKEQE